MIHTRESITNLLVEKFGLCTYDDPTHTYTLGGRKIPSVTKRKKELGKEFDAHGIARNMARKTGKSPEEIKQGWSDIADAGTIIHEFMEKLLFGYAYRPCDLEKFSLDARSRAHDIIILGICDMMAREITEARKLIPICSELTLWNANNAGTLDLLCYDPETGKYHVWDYKTNAKGAFDRETPWTDWLGDPFSKWRATKANEYSVQLESYALMLEEIGLSVGEGVIIHGWIDRSGLGETVDIYPTDVRMRPICREWLSE